MFSESQTCGLNFFSNMLLGISSRQYGTCTLKAKSQLCHGQAGGSGDPSPSLEGSMAIGRAETPLPGGIALRRR